MELSSGKIVRPRKLLLYGEQKVGKSTLAAGITGAMVLDIEEGTLDIDCNRWPKLINDYGSYQDAVSWLMVIDSFTKLCELLAAHIVKKNGKSIGEIGGGYGKGENKIVEEFSVVWNSVNALVRAGIAVVMVAHSTTEKITPADGPSYGKTVPDLPDRISAMIARYCDEVFCMQQGSYQVEEKEGFGATRKINKSNGSRELIIADTGSVLAGNRLGIAANKIDVKQFSFYVDRLCPKSVTPQPVTVAAVEEQQQQQPTTPSPWEPVVPTNEVSAELAEGFPG
jgi:hypothetical protein